MLCADEVMQSWQRGRGNRWRRPCRVGSCNVGFKTGLLVRCSSCQKYAYVQAVSTGGPSQASTNKNLVFTNRTVFLSLYYHACRIKAFPMANMSAGQAYYTYNSQTETRSQHATTGTMALTDGPAECFHLAGVATMLCYFVNGTAWQGSLCSWVGLAARRTVRPRRWC